MKPPPKTSTIISSVILGLASLNITNNLYAEVSVYIVAPGDTLWSIANENLKSPHDWKQLKKYNDISDTAQLKVGQTLGIPTEWMTNTARTNTTMQASKLSPRRANIVAATYGIVEKTNGNQQKTLKVNTTLRYGDQIRTGANSSANIQLKDGSVLALLPDTEIILDSPVELARGSVELTQVGPNEKPRITTAAGSISAAQSRVRIIATHEQQMQIEVQEGSVTVASNGKTRTLTAGLAMRVENGKPMPEPSQGLLRPDLTNLPKSSVNGEIKLSWPEIANASSYRAQLVYADDNYLVLYDQKLDESSLAWNNINPGRYIVRLRSIDDTGLEGLDAELSYTVLATLEAPLSKSPQEGVTLPNKKPWIAWSRVPEANSYTLQVARDVEFKTELQEHSHLINNYFNYNAPLASGEYFWRVKSVSPKQVKSQFGEVRMFKVKPEASAE